MRIYLACTVRGDRGALDATRSVAALIERAGHRVLTSHLLEDGVDAAESALTERQVFDRDLEWLSQADGVIAEASGSSFGVGFEVGYALANGRRVLLLYDAARRAQVSRLIVGNAHPCCTTVGYASQDHLLAAVEDFLCAR